MEKSNSYVNKNNNKTKAKQGLDKSHKGSNRMGQQRRATEKKNASACTAA